MQSFIVVLRQADDEAPSSASLNQSTHHLSQHILTLLSQIGEGFQDVPSHEDFPNNMLHLCPTLQFAPHILQILFFLI